jgi:hypothetical protein
VRWHQLCLAGLPTAYYWVLKCWWSLSWSRISPPFMETEGSFPCLQQLATRPCPQSDESIQIACHFSLLRSPHTVLPSHSSCNAVVCILRGWQYPAAPGLVDRLLSAVRDNLFPMCAVPPLPPSLFISCAPSLPPSTAVPCCGDKRHGLKQILIVLDLQ